MAKLDLSELSYWSSSTCHAAEKRNNVELMEMEMEMEIWRDLRL